MGLVYSLRVTKVTRLKKYTRQSFKRARELKDSNIDQDKVKSLANGAT
jgi:hypothetical protein